ncbi:uncharacterized protein [Halyomorpha halys]|uniref:uncharacterized protein n=1 Tax=Halyomorpha halys TaxID=286706 RepID=UPI0006D4DB09|nr:uncharacterized protein LOC106690034 [Halyomorpha halys]XP_024220182.1 uncharacterized protein LOC106690034 [Halyomorpha halys]XP_024220183.1 uncharacterized protein LOC106690034 [Halyomorpha halys]KAE8573909.1 EcKinase 20 [Halyomorpha halys]
MEKEVLEAVIHHNDRVERVEKVIKVKSGSAVGPGENYCSTVHKLRAKVLLGSGRAVNRTYILKKVTPSGGQESLFQAETKIYSNVLKQMEYLMEEFGDTEEPLWCQLIYHEPYTTMLLEDLQGRGYKTVNRCTGLDFDHGLQAIRALGRFHGLAKVLEERGIISKDGYNLHHGVNKEVVQTMTYPAVQNLIAGIRTWGPEWDDIAAKLDLPFDKFFKFACKSFKVKRPDFKVLNHGDCWSNNILFKYDWRMKPISVKFIDFQNPHHNSPFIDVSHFLYYSMQPPIRRNSYNYLLENYLESLISTLTKYGYQGPKPSMDDVHCAMDRLSYFWLYVYAAWYPYIIAEPKETSELAIIVQTKGQEGFSPEVYKDRKVKEQLAPDIQYLAEKSHNFPNLHS